MTETVDVTSSMNWYGNDMHIVLAPTRHGAQLDGVHDGRDAKMACVRSGLIMKEAYRDLRLSDVDAYSFPSCYLLTSVVVEIMAGVELKVVDGRFNRLNCNEEYEGP